MAQMVKSTTSHPKAHALATQMNTPPGTLQEANNEGTQCPDAIEKAAKMRKMLQDRIFQQDVQERTGISAKTFESIPSPPPLRPKELVFGAAAGAGQGVGFGGMFWERFGCPSPGERQHIQHSLVSARYEKQEVEAEKAAGYRARRWQEAGVVKSENKTQHSPTPKGPGVASPGNSPPKAENRGVLGAVFSSPAATGSVGQVSGARLIESSTSIKWMEAQRRFGEKQDTFFNRLAIHQEQARVQDELREARVTEAPRHARDTFASLRSLGDAYQIVCSQRHLQGLGNPVREPALKAFARLVEFLRRARDRRGVTASDEHAETLRVAARELEQHSSDQCEALETIQLSIAKEIVALPDLPFESLQELPEEVKQKIQYRDLLRAETASKLRSEMQKMLRGIHVIMEGCALEELEEEDTDLESALTDACRGLEVYNMQLRAWAGAAEMGVHCTSSTVARLESDDESREVSLTSYDEWMETFLGTGHALESDAAMLALRACFADDTVIVAILACGGEAREVDSVKALEQALDLAGSSIAEERKYQRKDLLSVFPCTALLWAGRQLLEARQAQRAALGRVAQVHQQLEEDVHVNEEHLEKCLLEKHEVMKRFNDAKVLHKKATIELQMLTTAIDSGDADMARRALQVMNLSNDTTLEHLQYRLQASLSDLTTQALQLMGGIQRQFPELIVFILQGLPPKIRMLWRPPQSLDLFDEKKLVQREFREEGALLSKPPRVWRVRMGKEWFAVKEYSAGQASDLRTFLTEANTIHKQRHHAIIEIKALFQGTSPYSWLSFDTVCLQMPWYAHGSLDKWVSGDERPDWRQVRSVLFDALLGLAHLHHNGVIHGDVKPANILVDGRERGRLADFDISIDRKERTSAARIISKTTITMRAAALGTPDFAAPELRSSGEATKHTDMFAYGMTVSCLHDHCEPGGDVLTASHGQAQGQTALLVAILTSTDPKTRLPAKDGICWPFFSMLKDVRVKATSTCLFCEMNGEDGVKDRDAGIQCEQGHFHCAQCVLTLTKDLLKIENSWRLAQHEGQVMCFKYPGECSAAGFQDRDLARHLSNDAFQSLLSAKIEIMEAKMKLELEDQMKEQLADELRRLAGLDERARKVIVARKHVEEEILQMKCPRCKTAFYDFEGCFAIKCSSCPTSFCGWCLRDCGGDAHSHVRGCAKVPAGVDALFPRTPNVREAFEKTHKQRCKERIDVFLQTLDIGIREEVKTTVLVLL